MRQYIIATALIAGILSATPAFGQVKIDSFTCNPSSVCQGDMVTFKWKTSRPVPWAQLLGMEKQPFIVYLSDSFGQISIPVFKTHQYKLTVQLPNGQYIHDTVFVTVVDCPSLGVEQTIAQETVDAYPNPCTDNLVLTCSGQCTCVLMNSYGSIVAKQTGRERLVFEMSDLPSGIYFVQIVSGDGNKSIKKVLKM